MSIGCRNGGVSHTHDTVAEVRQCHGIAADAPIKNVVPNGPKPGDPDKAKRIEAARAEEARNTALARAGQPHGFTSKCPQCVGIGAGHAVAKRIPSSHDGQDDRSMLDHEPALSPAFVVGIEDFREDLAREALQYQTSASERTAFLNEESRERPARNGFGSTRPNRYGGTCSGCGQYVNAEEGLLGPKVAGKFTIKHKDGECPPPNPAKQSADGDPAGYGDPQPHSPRLDQLVDRKPLPDVPEGHYAIPSLTGNNDLDFFRVDRPEKDGRKKTFIKRVIGGKPNKNIRWTQYRDVLEAIVKMGPEKSAQKYGQEIGRCSRCNRHLTDETSRAYGMGPECRSK